MADFDPDAYLAQPPDQSSDQPASAQPPGFDPDAYLATPPQDQQSPLVTAGEHALARAPVGAAAGVGGLVGASEGLAAGTAAAPFLGPLAPAGPIGGAIIGGLGGGAAVGWLASKPVDWILDKLGLNDSLKTGAQQNPTAAFMGDLAGNTLPAFGAGAASLGTRAIGAAIGAGTEAGSELMNEGSVDPGKVAMAAGANAAFPNARGWAAGAAARVPSFRGAGTGAIQNPVASSPEQPGRSDLKAVPTEGADKDDLVIANDITTTAPGIAAANPPAPEIEGAGNPTGAPMLARSAARPNDPARNYGKGATLGASGISTAETTVISTAPIHEDISAALAGEQPPDTTGLAQPDANGRIPLTPDEPATPPAPAPQPQPDAHGRIPLTPEEPDQGLVQSATQRAMRRPITVSPMPSIANSGKARNSPVVIDPLVPEQYHRPLAVHETVEQTLMAEGIPYAKAHEVATQAEKQAVERAGMNWDEYTESMAGLAKKIEAQKVDPESYAHLDLHVDPEEAIGHHADKNAPAQDVTAAVTPQEQRITAIAHQKLDEAIKARPEMKVVKDRLSALPPKEQAVKSAALLNAMESVSGEAPGTGEVRVPTQRPQVGEAMARSKPDAVRKQTALDAWKAAYQKFGPSAGPLDPTDTAGVVERAKAAMAAATEANGGKDPLESYRVKKNIPPEAKWLRAARNVVRNPSAGPIKEFTAAHALGGETGQNIEGELANKRLPTETGADLSDAGRETFDHMYPIVGKDNTYVDAHNRLVDYVNELPNPEYRRLADQYDLHNELDQPADPDELLSQLKQTLADTGKRPGIVEVPAEDIPGKAKPIRNKAELDRFDATEPGAPASEGKVLDKNSDEFKALAAKYSDVIDPTAGPKPKQEALDGSWDSFKDTAASFLQDTSGSGKSLIPLSWMRRQPNNILSPDADAVAREYAKSLGDRFNEFSRSAQQVRMLVRAASQMAGKVTPEQARDAYRAIEDRKVNDLTDEKSFNMAHIAQKVMAETQKVLGNIRWMDSDNIFDLPPASSMTGIEKDHLARLRVAEKPADADDADLFEGKNRFLTTSKDSLKRRDFYTMTDGKGTRLVFKPTDDGIDIYRNGKPQSRNVPPDFEGNVGDTFHMSVNGTNRKFTVDNATAREIMQHVRDDDGKAMQFHENPLLTASNALIQAQDAHDTFKLIRDVTNDPDFEKLSTTDYAKAKENGWVQTKLEPFTERNGQPLYMPRRVAEVLDDYRHPGFDAASLERMRRVGSALIKTLFVTNPLIHGINETAQWATQRHLNLITPSGNRRLADTGWRAIKAVMQQDPEIYNEMLEHGASLMLPGTKTSRITSQIAKQAGGQLMHDPPKAWDPIAKAWGVDIRDVGRWMAQKSNSITWGISDALLIQRYLENKEYGGMFPKDAIREAAQFISDYRVPTRVGMDNDVGRLVSQVAQEPAFSLFGPYHYGLFKSFAAIKDGIVKGSKEQRIKSAGQLLTLGTVLFGVYPYLFDKAAQGITGNPNASLGRRGMYAVAQSIQDMFSNRPNPNRMSPNLFTPSIPLDVGSQILSNKDFTGHPIVPPFNKANPAEWARATAHVFDWGLSTTIPPYQTLSSEVKKGGGMGAVGQKLGEDMVGIKNPSLAAVKYANSGHRRDMQENRYRLKHSGPLESLANKLR